MKRFSPPRSQSKRPYGSRRVGRGTPRDYPTPNDPNVEVLTPSGITLRMEEVLTAPLLHIGYEIVRIHVAGKHRLNIQLMIERSDRAPITIDDCVEANECTRHWLNIENFIAQDYLLEISSPGWDRPLTKPEHFQRFCGNKVNIRTRHAIDGQKRFLGVLECASDHNIKLVWDATSIELTYDQIEQARLAP